jgi:hypothetical protein
VADPLTPLDALQATLAGEHAALYVLGVLGGQVSRSAQPALAGLIADGYATHRRQRDRLDALVTAHRADPVAAAPAYRLPNAASTPAQLRAAARQVETRCLDLYGQLVGSTSGRDRAWAITALDAGAVRVLGYGAPPGNFPGNVTGDVAGAAGPAAR